MVDFCNEEQCTGCGLCEQICGKHAIKLSCESGFWRPIVTDECIECGACKNVCPSLKRNTNMLFTDMYDNYRHRCYAAWGKDEYNHFMSSSGGLATLIARQFLLSFKPAIVVGAMYNPETCLVEHRVASNVEEIELFKKSKYTKSNLSKAYSEVKKTLNSNHKISVLFIGVPCEVNAWRTFVKIQNIENQTFFIDLLCHGGSSPKCLQEHIGRIDRSISSISFRGGRFDCNFTAYDCNSKLLYLSAQFVDPYFKTFMKHTLYQKACFDCKYAGRIREGDLTLGDFWGLNKEILERSHFKGANLVLINNCKGQKLFLES